MPKIVLAAAAVAAMVITAPGTAGADPDTRTIAGLRHSRARRSGGWGFADPPADLWSAAAGLRRELVTGHWKLGIPAREPGSPMWW
jgi:hypothetical protein